MIPREYIPPYKRYEEQEKQSQRFIPRRDLFPDAYLQADYEKPSYPVMDTENDQSKPKKISKSQIEESRPRREPLSQQSSEPPPYSAFNPQLLIILVFGGIILWPQIKRILADLNLNIPSSIKSAFGNPASYKLLKTIAPYMEGQEQETIYTLAGMLEAMETVHDVLNHTYHQRHQNKVLMIADDPIEKNIEMIKAIKPYFRDKEQKTISNVLHTYDTINELNRNMRNFENKRKRSNYKALNNTEMISEIFKVIKPILPHEYREQIDKATQALSMVNAMQSSKSPSNPTPKKAKIIDLDKEQGTGQNYNNIRETGDRDIIATDKADKTKQIDGLVDSLKSMLNDEQKQSVDVIMKMAQLLAQTNDDKDNNSTI